MPSTTEAIQLIYSLDFFYLIFFASNGKLDVVGPIDNRPSNTKPQKTTKQTGDMWHMTCDTWHMTGGENSVKIWAI